MSESKDSEPKRIGDALGILSGPEFKKKHGVEKEDLIKVPCRKECGRSVEMRAGVHYLFNARPICPVCDVAQSNQVSDEQKDSREARWRDVCPPGFRETDEGNPDFNLWAWSRVQTLWQFGRKGLVLRGATGTCKTRIMMLLLRRELLAGYTVSVVWPEELRSIARGSAMRGREAEAIRALGGPAVLGLDDPLLQGARDERVSTFLKDLLAYRGRARLPTLVTTQIGSEGFMEATESGYGERSEQAEARGEALMRLLTENSIVMDFETK